MDNTNASSYQASQAYMSSELQKFSEEFNRRAKLNVNKPSSSSSISNNQSTNKGNRSFLTIFYRT